MDDVKVSIIIPAYNAEEYITECLMSCVNQTLSNIEIIIINDGSTDNTQNIIDEFKVQNPTSIKSFEIKNGGAGNARNYGLTKALGKYIAFVDSDDIISSDYCLEMYSAATTSKSEVVRCDYARFSNASELNNINVVSSKFEKFIGINGDTHTKLNQKLQNILWHISCTGLYSKELLDRMDFKYPNTIIEDPIIRNIYLSANQITLVPKNLYYYRETEGSVTSYIDIETRREALSVWQLVFDYYEERNHLYDYGVIESFYKSAASLAGLNKTINFYSLKELKNKSDQGLFDEFYLLHNKLDPNLEIAKSCMSAFGAKFLFSQARDLYNRKCLKVKFKAFFYGGLLKLKSILNGS